MTDTPEIKLYSLSTCSHCKSTKRLFDKYNVKFEFVDVDLLEKSERKTVLNDLKELNPRRSFPTVVIGSKVIVGYKEDEIMEAIKGNGR